MNPHKFAIWQCTDWCCDDKPYRLKWWNVSAAPGYYRSRRSWVDALQEALEGAWR